MDEIGRIAGLSVLGVLLRYGVGLWITSAITSDLPWATLTINLVGSFAIGIVSGVAKRNGLSEEWRLALMVGLLGGFTTFSAFSLETLRLWESGQRTIAGLYLVGTPILSVILCGLGRDLAR
jgi:CrcB protein